MGVTRLDELPERQLVRVLEDARQTEQERKGAAQFVGGSSLAFFVSKSAAQFDWSGRLSTVDPSGHGMAGFVVSFLSETAEVPLTDISVTCYHSTDGVNWSEYTYGRGIAESYNGTNPGITRFIQELQGAEIAPNTSMYSLMFYGQLNAWWAFKVEAVGTDEVMINVTRTV